jgi:diacylglycerol kinase family enzyme
MHYPTDVAAGALNGTLWVFLAVSTLLPKAPTPPEEDLGGYRQPVVIRNPTKSGDLKALESEVDALFVANGLPPARWIDTTAADTGRGQTEQALADGADLILACGGDGTVRACVSAMVGSNVPLALLPTGTGNLLARNLDVPRTLGEAIRLISTGDRRVIDVAELDGDVFAVMGGAGFDAQLFDFTSDRLKSRIGWGAYVVAGARALYAAQPGDILLTLDGVLTPTRGVGVLIGNVGTLTGGIALLPLARPDDGHLDIAVLTATSPAHWFGLVWHVVTGKRPQPWQLEHHTAATVEVSFEAEQPVELDGDIVGPRRRFTARVRPASLIVCAPVSASMASA